MPSGKLTDQLACSQNLISFLICKISVLMRWLTQHEEDLSELLIDPNVISRESAEDSELRKIFEYGREAKKSYRRPCTPFKKKGGIMHFPMAYFMERQKCHTKMFEKKDQRISSCDIHRCGAHESWSAWSPLVANHRQRLGGPCNKMFRLNFNFEESRENVFEPLVSALSISYTSILPVFSRTKCFLSSWPHFLNGQKFL